MTNVLLLHVKQNVLPAQLLDAPEIGRLTVITEPGHLQQYGPEVDVRLVDSVRDTEQVRLAALEVLREQEIDRVVAPFELGLPVAGYLRSYFGLPGMGYETANAFANKYVMKQRMAAAGLPTAAFRIAYGLGGVAVKAQEIGWPVVVKPVIGGGSINVVVLSDAEHLTRFARSPEGDAMNTLDVPLIVEEFIEMDGEYHCDGIVQNGEIQFVSPSLYFTPVLGRVGNFGSYCLPEEHPDRAEILALHSRAARALGIESGVTHMELFRTPRGLVVGEIACRPGGGGVVSGIRLQYGVDLWRALLLTSLGLEPEIEVRRRPDVVGHYYLPVTPGSITALTPVEELEALPSVLRVEMTRKIGDVISPVPNSTSSAGLVYFTMERGRDVSARIQEILGRYVLEIDGEPAEIEVRMPTLS
ncbi:ATP-grasp domain-containing protein [Lentzea sp. BCCO 10_0798]|uniref:ATP-grasp domain-containing protein n=1 Tax=Lentzea kristufekii TaxID=3095430 RepID=A0ABU4TKF6_9PSEU|nr:ATP-grasp domain-containing protein [Lentzea sp. BCCO 10_0798]MDX8048554.1 ATP-grasp domain-containing protein [Lentzea sp. BCCO 10_0798]